MMYNLFIAEDDDMGIPDDMNVHLRLLSLLENPAVVVAAAAAGDVSTLKEFLTKHPKEVGKMYGWMDGWMDG